MSTEDKIKDKIKGCIFGQALGDALGAYLEFRSKNMIVKDYPTINSLDFIPHVPVSFMKRDTKGDWTDDTDHTILVMEMLTETQNKLSVNLFAKKLINWVNYGFSELGDKKGNGCGGFMYRVITHPNFGDNPLSVSRDLHAQTKNASNGSLMRTMIMGCRNLPRKEVINDAVMLSRCTHYGDECTTAVKIITDIIYCLIFSKRPQYLPETLPDSLDPLRLDDTTMGYVQKCLNVGLFAYKYRETDFKYIIKKIVLEGGDADTNAGVAGAILGSAIGYKNLPQDWINKLPHKEWLNKKIDKFIDVCIK